VSLYSVAKCCPSSVTGADLFSVCNEATRSALRRTISDLEKKGECKLCRPVGMVRDRIFIPSICYSTIKAARVTIPFFDKLATVYLVVVLKWLTFSSF